MPIDSRMGTDPAEIVEQAEQGMCRNLTDTGGCIHAETFWGEMFCKLRKPSFPRRCKRYQEAVERG